MSAVSYTGGEDHLLVVGQRIAFSSDAALVGRLWLELLAGTPTDAVLDTLLRSGLGSLPDLVVLDAADSALRLLIRGPHQVHLEHSGGQLEVVSAADVATWVDRVVAMPASVWVGQVAETGGGMPLGAGLPLGLGIVLAGGFRWSSAAPDGNGVPAGLRKRTAPITPVRSPVPVPALVTAAPQLPAHAEPVPSASSSDAAQLDESVAVESAPLVVPPLVVPPVVEVPPTEVPPMAVSRALGETRAEPAEAAFDHLFGSTVMRSVEDAAVRDPSDAAPIDAAPIDAAPIDAAPIDAGPLDTAPFNAAVVDALRSGDHDGSTVMKADLGPARPAVVIRRGPRDAGIIARLLLSTGEVIEILDNSGVLVGRRPQVDRVAGGALPLMVTVPSPNSDISRSHLRLDAVQGRLTATDLRSTNGTVLTEVDGTATHLIAGEGRTVHPGDVLAVGDGITVTVLEPA